MFWMKLIPWLAATLLFQRFLRPARTHHLVETQVLNPMQEFGHDYAKSLLALAIEQGLLNPVHIQTICDFGAGTGGPTLALRELFRGSDANLTLLESDRVQGRTLRQLFPRSQHDNGNGLNWLAACKQPQDLITGFMLGPDYDGAGLVFSLIHNALECLSPNGKLVICSDTATLHKVQQVLQEISGLQCDWMLQPEHANLPTTVIISRAQSPNALQLNNPPPLPTPVKKTISVPDAYGGWETEEYCVTTRFERAYLQATLKTFECLQPTHPAIPHLQRFLKDCELPSPATVSVVGE